MESLIIAWMSQKVSKWLVNGLSPDYNPGILGLEPTDPNLLPALPTGHPSGSLTKGSFRNFEG